MCLLKRSKVHAIWAIFTCHVLCALASVENTTGIMDYLETMTPLEEQSLYSCGENLTVTYNASMLHFPKSSETVAVHCRWILTAPPGHRIAISSVYARYNFPVQFAHWIAFDGSDWTDVDRVISYTELKGSSIDGDWLPGLNHNPILSKTNVVLLDYVSFGDAPIEASMLFYSCGGIVRGHGLVRAPVFQFPDLSGIPLLLQCTWELHMEEQSLYSSMQLNEMNVRDDCTVLHISTNGIMKTVLPNNTTLKRTSPGNTTSSVMNVCRTHTFMTKTGRKSRRTHQEALVAETSENTEAPPSRSEMYLCQKNIQPEKISSRKLFLTGNLTKLHYNLPCLLADVGFVFTFHSYPHYNSIFFEKKLSPGRPIIVTYAGLFIWVPVGALLGIAIMCIHMRRKTFPKTSAVHYNVEVADCSTWESMGSTQQKDALVSSDTDSKPTKSIVKCTTNAGNEGLLVGRDRANPRNVPISQINCNSDREKQSNLKITKHVKFKSQNDVSHV